MDDKYALTAPQKSRSLLRIQTPYREVLNDANTLTLVFKVHHAFQSEAMVRSYNHIIKKFDSLRLYFFKDGLHIKQKILPYEHIDVDVKKIDDWEKIADISRETKWLPSINANPIHAQIVTCEDKGALIIKVHHNLADGYSLSLIANELKTAYGELANGNDNLDETSPSIVEFFKSQEKYLTSKKYKRDKDFWTRENLHQRNYHAAAKWIPLGPTKQRNHTISGETYQQLLKIKNDNFCSLEFLVEYAIALTVYKLKGIDNFSYSVLGHGRRNAKLLRTVGNLHELFTVYWDLDVDRSVNDQIETLSKKYLEYMSHGQYPFFNQIVSSSKEAIKSGFNFGHTSWLCFSSIDGNLHECGDEYSFEMISPTYNACQFFVEMFHEKDGRIFFDVGHSTAHTDQKIEEIFSAFDKTIAFMVTRGNERIANLTI